MNAPIPAPTEITVPSPGTTISISLFPPMYCFNDSYSNFSPPFNIGYNCGYKFKAAIPPRAAPVEDCRKTSEIYSTTSGSES